MTDKQRIDLLRYELKTLRQLNKIERVINSLGYFEGFVNIVFPSCNYELLNKVLDDLGIPEDCQETPRDYYNDTFCDLVYAKKISNKDLKQFIKDCINWNNKGVKNV